MENNQQQLNTKSEYELKHQKKLDEHLRAQRQKTIKRISRIVLIVAIVGGGISALGWWIAEQSTTPPSEILSRSGIHWHPELVVFVDGEKQEIPANIGIGVTHNPLHTHDSSGVIHLEFQGAVRRDDIKLGKFFEVWGKDFMELGSSVKMKVNGEENTELQNYIMGDGDKIELHYNK